MKYIAIGDIHGRLDLLDELLLRIRLISSLKDHILMFLGDMNDRGPDSYGVIEVVKGLVEAGKAIALRGNHEDMMLEWVDWHEGDRTHYWFPNGAGKTIESYGRATKLYGMGRFPMALGKTGHYGWLKKLPYFHETDEVWFSHAPIAADYKARRGVDDFRLDSHSMTWTFFGNEGEPAYDHGKLAVCGHVHALQEGVYTPRMFPKIVYADTGSGCGALGRLTGIIIEDGKVVDYLQASPDTLAVIEGLGPEGE